MNTVTIHSQGDKRIQVIKGIRALTDLSLRDAKALGDAVGYDKATYNPDDFRFEHVDGRPQTFETAADEQTVQDQLGGLCEYTFASQSPLSTIIDLLRPYAQDASTGNLTVCDLYYCLKITHEAIGN